jgi:GNAT superfamily N-acetyltransferase
VDSWAAGIVPAHLSYEYHRDVVLPWLLARPGVQVWVAANPGETDARLNLYGHCVIERDVVLPSRVRVPGPTGRRVWATKLVGSNVPLVGWVYVKEAKRGHGIARALLRAAGIDLARPLFFSCKPANWPELAHLAPHATWRPDISRREKKPPEVTL